jgi:hypothetical protein
MSAEEFRAMLDWFMLSDGFPLGMLERGIIEDFLNREADLRGYDTWVDAYHEWMGGRRRG